MRRDKEKMYVELNKSMVKFVNLSEDYLEDLAELKELEK